MFTLYFRSTGSTFYNKMYNIPNVIIICTYMKAQMDYILVYNLFKGYLFKVA